MGKFRCVYVCEGGNPALIIPMPFEKMNAMTEQGRQGFRSGLQECATVAGLDATVCVVWQIGGSFRSVCPPLLRPTMSAIARAGGVEWVDANATSTLTCGSSGDVQPLASIPPQPSNSGDESTNSELEGPRSADGEHEEPK